jgi:hypothetical protein
MKARSESMELSTYCDNLATELGNWRERFDEIVKKIDMAESGSKSESISYINDLHMIRKELGDRIRRLKKECPASWEPDRIESPFARLESRWEDVWYKVSPGDIGG